MRGVPLATVSNLLGHTTPAMTLCYAHLSPKHLTSAVRMLDVQSDSSLDRLLDNRPKQSSPTAALVMGKSTVGPNNTLIDLMKEGGAEAGILSAGVAQVLEDMGNPRLYAYGYRVGHLSLFVATLTSSVRFTVWANTYLTPVSEDCFDTHSRSIK